MSADIHHLPRITHDDELSSRGVFMGRPMTIEWHVRKYPGLQAGMPPVQAVAVDSQTNLVACSDLCRSRHTARTRAVNRLMDFLRENGAL